MSPFTFAPALRMSRELAEEFLRRGICLPVHPARVLALLDEIEQLRAEQRQEAAT